jgi:hypothetical protein
MATYSLTFPGYQGEIIPGSKTVFDFVQKQILFRKFLKATVKTSLSPE